MRDLVSCSWRASMSLNQMVLAGFPLRFCFWHPLRFFLSHGLSRVSSSFCCSNAELVESINLDDPFFSLQSADRRATVRTTNFVEPCSFQQKKKLRIVSLPSPSHTSCGVFSCLSGRALDLRVHLRLVPSFFTSLKLGLPVSQRCSLRGKKTISKTRDRKQQWCCFPLQTLFWLIRREPAESQLVMSSLSGSIHPKMHVLVHQWIRRYSSSFPHYYHVIWEQNNTVAFIKAFEFHKRIHQQSGISQIHNGSPCYLFTNIPNPAKCTSTSLHKRLWPKPFILSHYEGSLLKHQSGHQHHHDQHHYIIVIIVIVIHFIRTVLFISTIIITAMVMVILSFRFPFSLSVSF